MPLSPDDPILRARRELQNIQDMHQEAMALVTQQLHAYREANR